MITVNVEDYCNTCPCFEPEAVMHYEGSAVRSTVVRCIHASGCAVIAEHIRQETTGRRMP